MEVFPHFVLLDDDDFPQVYKSSVISKVIAATSQMTCILLCGQYSGLKSFAFIVYMVCLSVSVSEHT